MNIPKALREGDTIAIVSLSSGMLGEEFCSHNLKLGMERLRRYGLKPVCMPNTLKGITYLAEHPEERAADLKQAFADDAIRGIFCAIGGDDTYRLLPYLMEDLEFVKLVQDKPKLFSGFSDTTINHLMLYQLGLRTFYGPAFITDLGEISQDMLPYTEKAFQGYFAGNSYNQVTSSDIWYEERRDFSKKAMGTNRTAHKETRGYEILQGHGCFRGRLLGGCLDSFYDILSNTRYEDEQAVCERYSLFPDLEEWRGTILFLESCEEKPEPELVRKQLTALKSRGIFDVIHGILVGKPQDESYYEEYKAVYREVLENLSLPVLYNVNFGHATPRCVLPYGMDTLVDMDQRFIRFMEPMFAEEKE